MSEPELKFDWHVFVQLTSIRFLTALKAHMTSFIVPEIDIFLVPFSTDLSSPATTNTYLLQVLIKVYVS